MQFFAIDILNDRFNYLTTITLRLLVAVYLRISNYKAMKMKCVLVGMLIIMSVVASAHGEDRPEMTVVAAQGSEVFKVVYKGSTLGKVRMNILDSKGRTIHTATFAGKNGFICPVNFKGLPSGNYKIELIDDNGSSSQTVNYVTVHERKSIHMTKLKNEEGKLLFTVANAQNELIMIRVYDQHQKLIYSLSRKLKGDFAQVFRMPPGLTNYTFEVSDAAGNDKYFVF